MCKIQLLCLIRETSGRRYGYYLFATRRLLFIRNVAFYKCFLRFPIKFSLRDAWGTPRFTSERV